MVLVLFSDNNLKSFETYEIFFFFQADVIFSEYRSSDVYEIPQFTFASKWWTCI